jgi:serine/threonine protein kinase
MEFCEQGSLANHIGKLKSIEIKARLMLEIAQGLDYMHNTKSVVHRDLKPDNILIKDNSCKIADYGLSKNIKSYAQTKVGTPIYIAPELLLSDKYDFSVDIWSLGIIFIEILTNKRIIDHIGISIAMELPCQREPFPTETILNQIESTTFRRLVVAMLKKDPNKRINIAQVITVIKSKFSNSGGGEPKTGGNEKQELLENAAKLELLAQLMRGMAVKKSDVKEVPKP